MTTHIQDGALRPAPLAYSISQAVKISGVGRSTLYAAIKAGDLETLKIGARRLVMDEALRAWLSAHRVR